MRAVEARGRPDAAQAWLIVASGPLSENRTTLARSILSSSPIRASHRSISLSI